MMTFDQANRWLANRVNLPTKRGSAEISREIPVKVRAHCFFSVRVAEARILERLREVSDAFSRHEIGLAEARTKLKEFLIGENGYQPGTGPTNLAGTARLNLILEQNARMAAAVGMYQAGRDPDIEERFPCWRYIGSTSKNPRDSHAKYNGMVFRKDDPVWHRIFPPWDFGCKCSVEDCDDEPSKPIKVDAPESGFAFDPAHAFEEFDYDAIKDEMLREAAKAGVEEILETVKQPSAQDVSKFSSGHWETVGINLQTADPYPQDNKHKKLRPVYNAIRNGSEAEFVETITSKGANMDREFIGVYDAFGQPYWIGMGPKNIGMANFPELPRGCTFIHNHPHGGTFSTTDVKSFVNSNMKRMVASFLGKDSSGKEIVCQYTLTKKDSGVTLSIDEIQRRFSEAAQKTDDSFKAWQEVFHGTCYEISYHR